MTGKHNIQQKAIAVYPKFKVYSNRRKDVTAATCAAVSSNADVHRVYAQRIVVSEPFLMGVRSAMGNVRAIIYRYCLRFGSGWILPIELHDRFHTELRAAIWKFKAERDKIRGHAYREQVALARQQLGALFKEEDYPDELADRFDIDIKEGPIGDPATWQPNLEDSVVQQLRDGFTNMLDEQVAEATADAMRRLLGPLTKMATTLANVDKIFRDSLIENIRELLELMPAFNLTGDPSIVHILSEVRELVSTDPDFLRAHPSVRTEAAKKAAAIAESVQGIFGAPDDSSPDAVF